MTKKEKILFPFVGDSVGGSQIASILLIQNLFRLNCDFKIIIFLKEGELAHYIKKKKNSISKF